MTLPVIPNVGDFGTASWADIIAGWGQPWTAYNPTLTASTTNPTLGVTTLTGAFMQIGKTTHWRVVITLGTGFAAGSGNYIVSLPANSAWGAAEYHGSGLIVNNGAAKPVVVYLNTANSVLMWRASTEAVVTSAGPGVAWAVGNIISLGGTYQAQ